MAEGKWEGKELKKEGEMKDGNRRRMREKGKKRNGVKKMK